MVEVSVLFNEPKLLKRALVDAPEIPSAVSVLFNEPKLLKLPHTGVMPVHARRFSALQRAEIAETVTPMANAKTDTNVSVLFNEPKLLKQILALVGDR